MKLGPPAEGEVVEVKWPDGKLYGAKYLGLNVAHMYQVSTEQCLMLAEMDRRSQREAGISIVLLISKISIWGTSYFVKEAKT